MKKMLQEFKAFAMRGNVIDLAVGIVIGAAFGKIVTALVTNIIMPILSVITAGTDFSHMKLVLKGASKKATGEAVPEVSIGYGTFLSAIIDFTIIAFAIFLLVKLINIAKKKEEAKPAAPTTEQLLTEIRDLLKAKQ